MLVFFRTDRTAFFVKLGYYSISCLSHADITHAIDFICASMPDVCYVFIFIFSTLCGTYIINNNSSKSIQLVVILCRYTLGHFNCS